MKKPAPLTDLIMKLAAQPSGMRSSDVDGYSSHDANNRANVLVRGGRLHKVIINPRHSRFFTTPEAAQAYVRNELGAKPIAVASPAKSAGRTTFAPERGAPAPVRVAGDRLSPTAEVIIPPGLQVKVCPAPAYQRCPPDAAPPLRPGADDHRRVRSLGIGS